MGIFIQGTGSISPQGTHEEANFFEEPKTWDEPLMPCAEPDYKQFIPGRAARRMSRLVKMGVSAASLALQRAGTEQPDAILAGTGLGCMEETEKFLLSMLDQDEQMLNPTAFIQSTHNSIAGQLAISLGCKGYNHTYVHRALSFPSAMLDSCLLMKEKEASKVLVGGFDEMTEKNFFISRKVGQWKEGKVRNLDLLKYGTAGSIAGEGAHFFLLGPERTPSTLASLDAVDFFYKAETGERLSDKASRFLDQQGLVPSDLDAVIYGDSGDLESDRSFEELRSSLFNETPALCYKPFSGEYHTASAFAVWAAAQILHHGKVPDHLRMDRAKSEEATAPQRILVCDRYFGSDHSFFLLSR